MTQPLVSVNHTVYVRDLNQRVYRPREPGRLFSSGGPLERGHWSEAVVTKVGRINAEAAYRGGTIVFDKNTLRVKNDNIGTLRVVASKQAMEDCIFLASCDHLIVDAVRDCRDATLLRKIAEMLGVKEPSLDGVEP